MPRIESILWGCDLQIIARSESHDDLLKCEGFYLSTRASGSLKSKLELLAVCDPRKRIASDNRSLQSVHILSPWFQSQNKHQNRINTTAWCLASRFQNNKKQNSNLCNQSVTKTIPLWKPILSRFIIELKARKQSKLNFSWWQERRWPASAWDTAGRLQLR